MQDATHSPATHLWNIYTVWDTAPWCVLPKLICYDSLVSWANLGTRHGPFMCRIKGSVNQFMKKKKNMQEPCLIPNLWFLCWHTMTHFMSDSFNSWALWIFYEWHIHMKELCLDPTLTCHNSFLYIDMRWLNFYILTCHNSFLYIDMPRLVSIYWHSMTFSYQRLVPRLKWLND